MKLALSILVIVLSLHAGVANAARPTYVGKQAWEYIRDAMRKKNFDVITATSPGVFTGLFSNGNRNNIGSVYMICNWGLSSSSAHPFYECYPIDVWTGKKGRIRTR